MRDTLEYFSCCVANIMFTTNKFLSQRKQALCTDDALLRRTCTQGTTRIADPGPHLPLRIPNISVGQVTYHIW